MIRALLSGLNEDVRTQIEGYRTEYTSLDDCDSRVKTKMRDDVRARMYGYTLALRDAGIVTERGRQALYVYMTVPKFEKEG